MIEKVIKRDGRRVNFNLDKVSQAISKAFGSVGKVDVDLIEKLTLQTLQEAEKLTDKKSIKVEAIQDIVEGVLISNDLHEVAKSFIIYREERRRARLLKTDFMNSMADITFSLSSASDNKRENANVNADTAMGTMLKYGSESAKHFFALEVLPSAISKAHSSGDIHIHDLDFYPMTTTCTQIDIIKLFEGGFATGEGHLREPNDIISYSALACIAIQANQNDQHGGQSIPNFDYAMAIGVRKSYTKFYFKNIVKALELRGVENSEEIVEELKEKALSVNLKPTLAENKEYLDFEKDFLSKYTKEVNVIQDFAKKYSKKETQKATHQAMEAFIHNLNTMHSRAGAQVPFSSINYGTDTTAEGRLVMHEILNATEEGLGNGETPIFPIQIFKVKEGINYNKGEPNYDIFKRAIEVSAKRLFPNFSFIDAPFNLQYYKKDDYRTEISYMGCRTRVIGNVYDQTREIVTGRGNLSFTSINLPRLGILAKGDVEKFFLSLDEKIDLVIEQLLHRFEYQGQRTPRNFPFLMGQGVWLDSDKLGPDEPLREVLKHGTFTLGFIGLAECLKALTGFHHGESKESQELGLRIIKHMRDRMDQEASKRKLNFSLIATPAEGLSGRFVKLDKKVFGIIPEITDRDYYTNSFHVPVYYAIGAFDKIKTEAPYHALTNAGHISYIELDGDPIKNLSAFEAVIRCMKENGIGYGSINHPIDRDSICGYTGVIGDVCPKCGAVEGVNGVKFSRIRRITGYLVGTLDRFNNAKQKEVADRVKHNVKA
ncbi:MAG: anaerobic ribonucleoside triphosphate reductase [Bacillales bacterium]|jgi:ribonucleoside-triphosphate reductase|nr:anaerobic ribonucleoside triphosphate reductase [Bacillales bacterium]